MSTGSTGSSGGLLRDTTLADLETAWQERDVEAAILEADGHGTTSLALRLYALEIRVKTLICKRLVLDHLPKHCKTHEPPELLLFTGFSSELDDSINAKIRRNWDLLVLFGKERLNSLRYLPSAKALNGYDLGFLLTALDDPNDGVLAWLSRHP